MRTGSADWNGRASVQDAGGAGWGQSRAWAPSAGHQAACTPWEAQAREWSFLEFDELLQEDSRGKVERGRVRGRRFL